MRIQRWRPISVRARGILLSMRYYYSADEIREAEAPLLASLPDGVLMRRAANGLATAIARELLAHTDRPAMPPVPATSSRAIALARPLAARRIRAPSGSDASSGASASRIASAE